MIGYRNAAWQMGIARWAVVVVSLVGGIGEARAQRVDDEVPQQAPAVTRCRRGLPNFNPLTSLALQEDPTVNGPAIQELRRNGQAAVDFLMNQSELRKSPRWTAVLDAVAQQKDAEYSGLYWNTDLNEALAVAKREKKPVLSLRLLGKLTDELSCANSRFFRTTLYPNAGVRDLLANQFVLHWQSVRAVPIITIDFGDGRQIRRTITGNSLHLVLDDQGRAIDVLPGLYTADAFARELKQSAAASQKIAGLAGDEFLQQRATYHDGRLKDVRQSWNAYCAAAKLNASLPIGVDHQPDVWTKIALAAGGAPVLDDSAHRAVIERGPPLAEVANKRALSKAVVEAPALVLIRNVSRVINEDSARNEYDLHARIHNWFATQSPVPEGGALVSRVYSELFLSPLDDPWYGLSRPDVYSAIKNDGRIDAVTQNTGD